MPEETAEDLLIEAKSLISDGEWGKVVALIASQHPADLVDLILELDEEHRTQLLDELPTDLVGQLFEFVERLKADLRLRIPCFGHAGDGNIHVNIMVTPGDEDEMRRAHEAEQLLFEGVVALEGSISGEHGIGFVKAKYLPIELDPETIAIMKAVKRAFDPEGILNPAKIFPS